MWSQPRNTIRDIAFNRPRFGVYFLASIYALQGFFFYANWWSLGIRERYPLYLALGIVLSPLVGILWLYLTGALFYLSGKLFHGQASLLQIRALVAWSAIPFTITLVMWLLLLFYTPEYTFIQESGPYSSIFINTITLMVKIWSFVLLIQSLREVQRFSLRVAIINILIVWFISWILFFVAFSLIRLIVI